MLKKIVPTSIVPNNSGLRGWALPNGAISRFGRGGVGSMALSPDGTSLAVASPIGLWWYELATMSPIALWETERGVVSTVAISHDGRLAATGNGDGVIKVWDIQRSVCISQMVRQSEQLPSPYRGAGIKHLTFSPDNQYLAATGIRDDIVYTWDPGTGTPLANFYDAQGISRIRVLARPIAFSPDNRLLVCTGPADTPDADFILVWDVVTNERIACLTEQCGFVNSLCFSPCGQSLAVGWYKGIVQVWDVNTWKKHRTFQGYDGTTRMSACYSQEGILHAMEVSRNTAVVWDVERHEKRYMYVEKEGHLQSALFSNGSHFIVAGAKEWTVWSPGDTELRKFLHSHTNIYPDSVMFSRDGKRLAAGSRDDCVLLWDIAKSLQPPTFFKLSGDQHAVSVSASGKIHAIGFAYDGNTVKVQEVGENTPHMTFTLPEREDVVTAAAFSTTENLIACADNKGRLYVWDVVSRDVQYVLTHPFLEDRDDDKISSLLFSHSGKRLVSITSLGPIAKLWDLDKGEEICDFSGRHVHTVAFSPCDSIIASSLYGEIRFGAAPTYGTFLMIHEPQGHKHPNVLFMPLCFSPCGRYLASGEWWTQGRMKVPIRLWDVATGENITTFWGHSTDIQDLAFSSDGTLLASGSFDGTILLWDMKPYLHHETS